MKTTMLLKVLLLYVVLLCLPVAPNFYLLISQTNWGAYQDIHRLVNYYPDFFSSSNANQCMLNTLILLTLAIVIASLWTYTSFKSTLSSPKKLFYILMVIARARLAIALISTGLLLLFAIYMPQPTISDLHTPYGDYEPWKVYYLTMGVAKDRYQEVLGLFQVMAGLLLVSRKTAPFGAALALLMLTNIVLANFAFHLGEEYDSIHLLLLALLVLLYDWKRIYGILIIRTHVRADQFDWRPKGLSQLKTALTCLLVIFTLIQSGKITQSKSQDRWPYPNNKRLDKLQGAYDVISFRLNGEELPYALDAPNRWRDVVFEDWNTMSILEPVTDSMNVLPKPTIRWETDSARRYESAGNTGRHFYRYRTNRDGKTVILTSSDGQTAHFNYIDTNPTEIQLDGIDIHGNAIRAVLKKMNKRYLLKVGGRREPIIIH